MPSTPKLAPLCLKKTDWGNREYPAVLPAAAPAPLKMVANKTANNAFALGGIRYEDLDDDGVKEALIVIEPGGSNDKLPWDWFVFRADAACAPEFVGTVHFSAKERPLFEAGTIYVVDKANDKNTHREHRLQDGKLVELPPSGKSPAICDESTYLDKLAKFSGDSVFDVSPCFRDRLDARLGKKKREFEDNWSGPLKTLVRLNGVLAAQGCRAHACAAYYSVVGVDVKTGDVGAAIVSHGTVKWFTAGKPPDAFKAYVDGIAADAKEMLRN